jgi:hypothetical protein
VEQSPQVYVTADNQQTTALAFKETDRQHDAQRGVTKYQFRPVKQQLLAYKPGDVLWASIALRESDEEWLLTWARSRSAVYQFERLTRPPRLHRKNQENTEGDITEDVTLTITEGNLPAVPDLMPVVKLEG